MKAHDEKVLEFVIQDKNLLILSNKDISSFSSIFKTFNNFVINDISKDTPSHINAILMQENTDLVIIYCEKDEETIIEIINIINEYNKKISIIIIIPSKDFEKNIAVINHADFVLVEPFETQNLQNKIYNSLNDTCSVKVAIKSPSNNERENENVEVFLDTFEGEILFLNEELIEFVTQIDNGSLSHELLTEIAQKMEEVSAVFSRHNYTKSASPIFKNLSIYLKLLDIQKIEIENIEGFVFLARIIDDIHTYLFEYFVSRIFVDVYIFEESLKNSIKFMQDRLKTSDNSHDNSELNFFDD